MQQLQLAETRIDLDLKHPEALVLNKKHIQLLCRRIRYGTVCSYIPAVIFICANIYPIAHFYATVKCRFFCKVKHIQTDATHNKACK